MPLDISDVFDMLDSGPAAHLHSHNSSAARRQVTRRPVHSCRGLLPCRCGMPMHDTHACIQAAGDIADVILLRDCPTQVVDAFGLSSATLQKIRENLVWAFGYNFVGVPVAAGALLPQFGLMLTPSMSGALMGVSSLAVMGNSLLLRREGTRPSLVTVESAGGAAAGGAEGPDAVVVPGLKSADA